MRIVAVIMAWIMGFVLGGISESVIELAPMWFWIVVIVLCAAFLLVLGLNGAFAPPATKDDMDRVATKDDMERGFERILSLSGRGLHGSRWQLSIEHIRARDTNKDDEQ